MRRWLVFTAVIGLGVHVLTGCKVLRRTSSNVDAGRDDAGVDASSLASTDATPVEAGAPVEAGVPLPRYRSDKMGFEVRFPDGKAPEVEDKVLGGGLVTAHLFKVQFGSSAYVVSVDELSPKAQGRTTEQILAGARDGLLESTGGTLDSDTAISLDGNPGVELAITATTSGIKMRQRARTYVVGGRVYQLLVVAPIWSGRATTEQEFLDSFALVAGSGGDGGP